MPEPQTNLERAIDLAIKSFTEWPQPISTETLITLLERGVQRRPTQLGDNTPDILGANKLMAVAAVHLRAIFDPENQPSQFGTTLI
jgi:hypothetical protein